MVCLCLERAFESPLQVHKQIYAKPRASLLALAHNSDRRRGVEIDFRRRGQIIIKSSLLSDYYIRELRACVYARRAWRSESQMSNGQRVESRLFGLWAMRCEFSIKIAGALLAAATPLNALCARRATFKDNKAIRFSRCYTLVLERWRITRCWESHIVPILHLCSPTRKFD